MMGWLIGAAVVCAFVIAAANKRNARLFREENATRERLGLPLLTRDQFRVTVVEKSAEYRGKVNQHM